MTPDAAGTSPPSTVTQEELVTAVEQTPRTTSAPTAFTDELRLRVEEAKASLAAAEATDDPLLAQIAEADLADLRALADRNDVDLP